MAALFDNLPVAGLKSSNARSSGGSIATSGSSGGSVLMSGERPLQWVYDEETSTCMLCNTQFTLIMRKHHCRRCGSVICHNCSPYKRHTSATNPFPTRVCNKCCAAVDERFASLERSGPSTTEIPTKSDPLIEGRVHIGQLYVKVVEAIGLPSTDSITSDPFVRVILTGKWSHGQEWGNDLKSVMCTKKKTCTLNPRWHETFVFNVCAPGAELVFEVYNHGQLSQPTKVGEASIPLSRLMDQRRHNKWLDLDLTEELRRAGPNNDARGGRIHVLLHYKFSRMAEFFSYFSAEQRFVYEWPQFDAAHLYSNFWVLLDNLWPSLEVIWQIIPTLNWEHPSHSFMCFALCVCLCLSLQWVPVMIHLALIAFTLRNYFERKMNSFSVDAPKKPPIPRLGVGDEEPIQFRQYMLPTSFNHLMNKMTQVTIDPETKRTLQSVQNSMARWSSIFHGLEMMFSWEDTFYTAKVVMFLVISCVLHIVIPNKYLLLTLVVCLFTRWTAPFQSLLHAMWALHQGVRSLIHQHRLTSRGQASDLLGTRDAMMRGHAQDFDRSRSRRTTSSASGRAHSVRDDMFEAAASAISERFVPNDGRVHAPRAAQRDGRIDANDGFLAVDAPSGKWNEPPFLANRISSDQLALVRHITAGEFGDLWLGNLGDTHVAIKQLKRNDQTQANALTFATEIERMTQLSHRKIAAFVGVEWTKQWETRAVAEFLPRGDLRSLLSSPEAAILDWTNFKCEAAMDIVDALVYLQSQPCALMGTLTSRNVLLDGDDGFCKLSLFAVARSRHRHLDSAPYLPWVAPEIVLGENSPAAASAIYSFGVLLCELDTARLPFFDAFNPDGSPMSSYKIAQLVALGKLEPSLSEECPEGIASLARDCLLFDPLSRPTAARIAYRLREVLKNDL